MIGFLNTLKNILPCCKSSVEKKKMNYDGPIDFEDAIDVTGFGRFNAILLVFCIPLCFSAIMDTTTMSYVIPSAECDLQLSFMHKGVLNAAVHGGMIASGFISGYLADTLGRRKIILIGTLLDGICNLIGSFSVNFWMLATCKFLAGASMCGPSLSIASYISEFSRKSIRSTVIMYIGLCYAFGSLLLPLVAWYFLENPFDLIILNSLKLHGWQLFLIFTSIPPFVVFIFMFFLPESPKFLASRGRNEEALDVLKTVFSVNCCKPKSEYPVKELAFSQTNKKNDAKPQNIEESNVNNSEKKESVLDALRGGLQQLKPLLFPPYIFKLVLILIIEFGTLMGCNTLRLWLPQLFKMMSESEESGLCEMISLGNKTIVDIPQPIDGHCEPIQIEEQVFENALIVATFQFSFAVAAGLLVGIIGKKKLLVSCLCGGGVCTLLMYWSTSIEQSRNLAAVALSLCAVSSNAVITFVVDLFPTALSAMATSTTLMIGRAGSISGNVMFPVLLAIGCLAPFMTLGLTLIGCAVFALVLKTSKKPKEETNQEG